MAGAALLDLAAQHVIDDGRADQQRQEVRPPPGIEGVGGQQQEHPSARRGAAFQQPVAQHGHGQKDEIGIGVKRHEPARSAKSFMAGTGANALLERIVNNVIAVPHRTAGAA